MAKPFDRLIDDLPADRRERIEAHTQALVKEYELLKALRKAGYDGVISIEHEDPRYGGEEGTSRSAAGLSRALAQMAEAA